MTARAHPATIATVTTPARRGHRGRTLDPIHGSRQQAGIRAVYAGALLLAGTVLAVLIGPRGPLGGFWRPAPEIPQPGGAVLAGLIGENLLECLAFGAGLAVLVLGRRWFGSRMAQGLPATLGWLATVWLFASWFPHGALHPHVGTQQPQALVVVEWIFHGGALLAITALVWAVSHVHIADPHPPVQPPEIEEI